MQTERGKAFEQQEPPLDDNEAHAAFRAGRAAVSLRSLPCINDAGIVEYLAVKVALASGGYVTVLLDPMAAAALREAIDSLDRLQWDGNALRAGPTPH